MVKRRFRKVAVILGVVSAAALAGILLASNAHTLIAVQPAAPSAIRRITDDRPLANDPRIERLRAFAMEQTFNALPEGHRARITAALDASADFLAANSSAAASPCTDHGAALDWSGVSDLHRDMLAFMEHQHARGVRVPIVCFAPGTREDLVAAFNRAIGFDGSRAQLNNRWNQTAIDGGGLSVGDPTTLTYSFAPDGTFCPDVIGITGNSNLFAYMNGIYGSPATWQAVFAQVFDRWSQLAGLTYVLEANDDGVQLNSFSGVLGVRGDLRIAGTFIDGPSSILAYNNFPNDGDMVLDTGDTYFNVTSSNSIRLRNVAAHEHGHGMGLLHVCPVLQTKLMEPFVTTVYDGPRHDDIRGAQTFYGDPYEDNDTAGTASDLGALNIGPALVIGPPPSPAVSNGSVLSIDNNGDQDYFRFTISGPIELTATVTPIGLTYDNSPQSSFCSGTGNCCSGNNFNSLTIANLNLDVRDQNGATVLATAASTGAGSSETVSGLTLTNPGNYYVRVYEGNTPNQAQLYHLSLTAATPSFVPLTIQLPVAPPAELSPGVPTAFDVVINPGDETVTPGSRLLHYRYDGGSFLTTPLVLVVGNTYSATLPAADCTDTPEFYVSAVGDTSGQVNNPSSGAAAPLVASVVSDSESVFTDNFQTDQGWTVSGNPVDGDWERGVPVAFDRGNPPTDSDGSGQCYLTDNDPGNDNSDVDDGTTTLTSPVFDLSLGGTISYDYWLNDVPLGLLDGDSLSVEVATNAGGTNWTLVRNYTSAQAAWRSDTIEVGVEVPASATVRIRFNASDLGMQNVVECGIDAVEVVGNICEVTGTCADGIQNQGEDRIDCGGPCPACACTSDAACNDADFCNGTSTCDAFGECQFNGIPCAGQSCRESDDTCIDFGDGDFDLDGDLDLEDFAGVQQCYGAEAFGACTIVNLTGTAEIDDQDAANFLQLLTGPQ